MATNDPEFYQSPKFTAEPPVAAPRQRGCFFYGCIIAIVLALLMAIMVAVGVYIGYRFLNQLVDQYTATAPRDLPKVEMPPEGVDLRQDRGGRDQGASQHPARKDRPAHAQGPLLERRS
jgi:hypothetical protein